MEQLRKCVSVTTTLRDSSTVCAEIEHIVCRNPVREMATAPSLCAWKIPGAEEARGLQSMGYKVGHD